MKNSSTTMMAGVAKVDITNTQSEPMDDPLYSNIDANTINDRLYVKALVLKQRETVAIVISIDAVAIAEIGTIREEYLSEVRLKLKTSLDIDPDNVLINASHCHGIVCSDIAERTVQAVTKAWETMVTVRVGVGCGYEDRIMENRRIKLKNGRETDVRRAYSLIPDEEVESVGPVDTEIGILKLEREDGRPLAVLYHFACHPIQGVPSGGNTADLSGFASALIETAVGNGAVALFIQGCAADINPVSYKSVESAPDAEPLGNLLGLSAVQALNDIEIQDGAELKLIREIIELPRADLSQEIVKLKEHQKMLLGSLQPTTLNLKNFIPLLVKYSLSPEYPSDSIHRYLHEEQMGKDYLRKLDSENRKNIEAYKENIHVMEELTRVQVNLELLKKHQARNRISKSTTISVELMGLRVGDFILTTFPGELSVETGNNIKRRAKHRLTYVSGVTNGYIYYTPTAKQLENIGGAQEDSDCFLAPEWQAMYEDKAVEIVNSL
jgi:hypothetical protein